MLQLTLKFEVISGTLQTLKHQEQHARAYFLTFKVYVSLNYYRGLGLLILVAVVVAVKVAVGI